MTEREVSSERVSGELRDAIAAIIAGNVDESRFYNAPAFQRAATEVILALRSSVKTETPAAASEVTIDVDALAQEIRRVDGRHDLGAGQLAEALLPFLTAALKGDRP